MSALLVVLILLPLAGAVACAALAGRPVAKPLGFAVSLAELVVAAVAWGVFAGALGTPAGAARADLFQDDVNDIAFVEPGQAFVRGLREVDDEGIAGTVRTLTRTVSGTGTGLSRLQTGFVRSYALSMVGGVALVVAALLIVQI